MITEIIDELDNLGLCISISLKNSSGRIMWFEEVKSQADILEFLLNVKKRYIKEG